MSGEYQCVALAAGSCPESLGHGVTQAEHIRNVFRLRNTTLSVLGQHA